MKKLCLLLILLISVASLCSCSIQTEGEDSIKTEEYRRVDEQYNYNWTIGVATEKEEDNLGTLLISDDEETPLRFTLGFSGAGDEKKQTTVQVKIYYDYEPVSFKLNQADGFAYSHDFDMTNHNKYIFDLLINPDELVWDEMVHKLFVTVTTGNDKYTMDLGFSNAAYGVSTIYDLVHSREYTDEVYVKPADFVKNESFSKVSEQNYAPNEFMINQDSSVDVKDGIALNLPAYTVPDNGKIVFQSFISYENEQDDFLILICLNFDIFAKIYIPAAGDSGTYSGDFVLEPGFEKMRYEYTAYTIVNPFKPIAEVSHQFISASNRFTIINE